MIKKIIKLKIIIVVCLFQIAVFGQNDTDHSEKASVILYTGLKLPESSDFDKTGFGFWAGLSLDIPLGLNWSIEPDFNYWKTQFVNHPKIEPDFNYWKAQFINHQMENVHIIGFSLLIAHTFKLQDFSLRFAIGPGLGNESNPFGQNAETIILFNFEISSQINPFPKEWQYHNQISLVPKIRYQIVGAPTHSGESFNPFLIGIGLQYKFLKN